MPSKLRKAIGAVKDQTSISLAKVSSINSSNLDVSVLKATTHEEIPVDDRYVNDVLLLTSSDKSYATACAQAIGKRIGRTRNWIVALKSLMLVLRIFQEGDPHFPREVIHAMKRGSKILNLSSFRDDSNSSPWDYTAFVRTFALYLDERLKCFLSGKLQRRTWRNNEPVRHMKPPMLLDKISHWQRLLDRIIATRPTGSAKTNRLVQISLYSVVRESFDLYRDISNCLALLLDSFFHLQYQSCVNAYQTCIKASKQFEELSSFYTLCKSIGVGRTSEYPSVQKISDELIETLQEFLKDQASFPTGNGRTRAPQLLLPAPPTMEDAASSSNQREGSEQSETSDQFDKISGGRDSDMGSEQYEQRTSLEDLMSVTDAGTSPSVSFNQERYLDQVREQSPIEDLISVDITGSSPSTSVDQELYLGCLENQSPLEDMFSVGVTATNPSVLNHQRDSSVLDLGILFDQTQQDKGQPLASGLAQGERDGWELVLFEGASNISSTQANHNVPVEVEPSFLNSLYNQGPMSQDHSNYNNPFLHDASEITANPIITTTTPVIPPVVDAFSCFPTFQATPTFCAQNPNETIAISHIENDPFASYIPISVVQTPDGSLNQQHLLHEQQLWLQNQNKIIAKHVT